MRILLIEDDKDTALTIKEELKKEYEIDLSFKGTEGEGLALTNNYDLFIIDLFLPDRSGIKICQSIRKERICTPILILTGENSINKKLAAFDCGADDYLTKPFSLHELRARIKALIRRSSENYGKTLSIGELSLDKEKGLASRGKATVRLRRKEIALLEYLMKNPGRVVTRDMILNNVWGNGNGSYGNTIDVHIKYLRDRIDRNHRKKLIKTIYGLGYKLEV